ncbi:MAG: hypothetical protein M5U26_06700 [Planctomycetota bacterium]|nr:hypothetical protein [Planctomycetota bacterium]
MAKNLDTAVTSVAVLIDDADLFRARAATVARELGPSAVEELATRFHSPPRTEPAGFGCEQRGLGGWLSAWQFAIFELFFQFGAAALPVVRRVAFGKYDWTQGNAIEVLVRLAAAGVERERAVADLRREFPNLRYEATLYSVGPLLRHAARDPAIAGVVRELEDLPSWREAAEELRAEGR